MMATETREQRGRQMFEKGVGIRRVNALEYQVRSQSGFGWYQIISTETGWICNCPDATHRLVKCKHAWAVEFSLKIRAAVGNETLIPIANTDACIYCGSQHIVKDGIRRNKSGDIQIFGCKGCGRYFTINLGFEKMKHNPQAITSAMQLYFSGESLRNVAESLKLMGAQVSHQTIHNWIAKYVGLMETYLDKITPNVSGTWRTDELYLKVKGSMKYLFAMMDDETRFRIAQMVAEHKGVSDVRPMFREARERANRRPSVLISDGAPNFHRAFVKEYWTNRIDATHIKDIQIRGKIHNNKMERQNGEWRDREKVMRSLKRDDSPILRGMKVYHNFIRPHMGLDGKTPAEAAGIRVEGENKWMTIIQNATKMKRV